MREKIIVYNQEIYEEVEVITLEIGSNIRLVSPKSVSSFQFTS